MFRKFFLPAVAVIGVVFAVYSVVTGQRQVPPAQPVAEPAQPRYESYVAGAGIIEASTENIAVGAFLPGVVTEIPVKVGDAVKAGQPLFKIDDRDLQAELTVRRAGERSAAARVQTESASLADARNQLEMWQAVADARAVSREELDRRRYAVQIQEAKLQQARADLQSAEALVTATRIELDRRSVKAPVDAEVLQVKIRLGEYAPTGALAAPLMLIGDTTTLHVRVDVDENDAWRVRPDAAASAFVRGNRDLKTDLKFVRIEPYVVPKRSLTGDSTERVDTRVLQVLYAFDRGRLPVYVGQQMDVFIDAPSTLAKAPPPASSLPAPAAAAK
ncbi:MAG TPA: HlyD family efflux transporter periplasmic adaptor subunit [Tepidisphaeraceae bacterium]|nr:HlyD family efflux transporter periplasmic adaptor subunit [Tepidisphaeraceae bacterium]